MVKIILFVSLIFSITNVSAKTKITKAYCLTVQKKIDTVNSKMRMGYKTQEGERLKAKLRTLFKQQRACKNIRFK